jgi:hypothetical protein
MGYRRFLTGLGLGLVLSVCIACSQRVLLSESAAPNSAPTRADAVAETISPSQAREGRWWPQNQLPQPPQSCLLRSRPGWPAHRGAWSTRPVKTCGWW